MFCQLTNFMLANSPDSIPAPEDFPELMSIYNKASDPSHGMFHINLVRKAAAVLADKYCPKSKRLIDLAAAFHDICREGPRGEEEHHVLGGQLIANDPKMQEKLTPGDLKLLCAMIKNHRASVGQPKSTEEQIISDADRMGSDSEHPLYRVYVFWTHGTQVSDATKRKLVFDAANHVKKKFGVGCYGTRTYFPETTAWIRKTYDPVIEAYDKKDYEALCSMLGPNA